MHAEQSSNSTSADKAAASAEKVDKSAKKLRAKRYTRPSVCLDYLKGQCQGRRFQCKYLHPDLTEFQHQFGPMEPGTESQVCEVWVLTGHCKFGSKCNKLHPPIVREEGAPDASKKGKKPKKLKDTDLEVLHAEGGEADTEADFDDFVDSLLSPFHGAGRSLPDKEAVAKPSSPATAEPTKLDHIDSVAESNLQAILGKPTVAFDQIFLDILSDLHLVSA